MCRQCFKDCGEPIVINDRVLRAAELIKKVYERHCTGGKLHIQLDDWNIEDRYWGKIEGDEVETECWAVMRELSLDERATALAIYDGFIEIKKQPENSGTGTAQED